MARKEDQAQRNGKVDPNRSDDLIDFDERSIEEIETSLMLWAESVWHDTHERRAYLRSLGWFLYVLLEILTVVIRFDAWVTDHLDMWRARWRSWWQEPENGHNGA